MQVYKLEAADEVVSKRLRRHQQTNGNSDYYRQSPTILRTRPISSPTAAIATKPNGAAASLVNRPFTIQSILDDAVATVVNQKLQHIKKRPLTNEYKPIQKPGNVNKLVESSRSVALA